MIAGRTYRDSNSTPNIISESACDITMAAQSTDQPTMASAEMDQRDAPVGIISKLLVADSEEDWSSIRTRYGRSIAVRSVCAASAKQIESASMVVRDVDRPNQRHPIGAEPAQGTVSLESVVWDARKAVQTRNLSASRVVSGPIGAAVSGGGSVNRFKTVGPIGASPPRNVRVRSTRNYVCTKHLKSTRSVNSSKTQTACDTEVACLVSTGRVWLPGMDVDQCDL